MEGIGSGVARGSSGVIVLTTGMSLRAFFGPSGSTTATMSPMVECSLMCLRR